MIRTCDCLDKQFHALANDTRLKIIELLRDYPLNAGELANYFTISHASISYHLQRLEQSNLVTVERLGRYKKYRLNKGAFEGISLWLSNLISTENRQERLQFLGHFRPEDLTVTLEREPNNTFDDNSIRIVIPGKSLPGEDHRRLCPQRELWSPDQYRGSEKGGADEISY